MKLSLSINNDIIIISNYLDGRWFAIRNCFGLPNCRNELIDIHIAENFLGHKLTRALSETISILSKMEKQQTYNELPFHHLIFNTTYKCNLKCKYCYFSANTVGSSIDPSTIVYTIKKCLNAMDKEQELTVLFQGGEALLEYKKIKEALDMIGDEKRIHYQMQTNGTLIDSEIMEFFEKYNIHVSFSLDSHISEHNILRTDDTDKFTRNIFNVCEMFKEKHMDYGLIAVVNKNNIDDLLAMYKKLISKDINMFAYNFLWPIGRAKDERLDELVVPTEKLIAVMFQLYKELYEYNINNGFRPFEKYRERNLYMLWHRLFYRNLSNYMCMNTPCGAGINTLTVDTNGDVYPCALMLPVLECGFKVGSIFDDSIEELLSRDSIIKHRNLSKISECSTCIYRAICAGGGCGVAFYHKNKDINEKSIYCDYYYGILTNMIKHAMDEKGLNTLKNF